MILLDTFSLITPDPGLLIWTTLVFIILWIVLGRFAFRPIARALRKRESSIEEALNAAELARQEVANMRADNEKLLIQAREERNLMLKEARSISDKMVHASKDKASAEATKMIEVARAEIDNQKMAAITEIKNQAGRLALDIAEKILRRELEDQKSQKAFISKLIEDVRLN